VKSRAIPLFSKEQEGNSRFSIMQKSLLFTNSNFGGVLPSRAEPSAVGVINTRILTTQPLPFDASVIKVSSCLFFGPRISLYSKTVTV
jgi:hypothetical protein